MTDNEIIKALECCGAGKYHCLGELCPKFRDNATTTVSECREVLMKDTIDLIKRQQAEIEKFENIKETLDEFWDILLKCKIAKRKEKPTLEEFAEAIQEIQDEAYKELAERLKEKALALHKSLDENCLYELSDEFIDRVVEELTGETFTKVEHNSLCETETYKGEC